MTSEQRGKLWVEDQWRRPEQLDMERLVEWTGIDEHTFISMVNRHMLYRVCSPADDGTYRYPAWQIEVDSLRMAAAIHEIFKVRPDIFSTGWVIHHFMLTPNDWLQEITPAQWLLDRPMEMDPLLTAIRRLKLKDADETGK